jgi:hypothetical protein
MPPAIKHNDLTIRVVSPGGGTGQTLQIRKGADVVYEFGAAADEQRIHVPASGRVTTGQELIFSFTSLMDESTGLVAVNLETLEARDGLLTTSYETFGALDLNESDRLVIMIDGDEPEIWVYDVVQASVSKYMFDGYGEELKWESDTTISVLSVYGEWESHELGGDTLSPC